MPKRKTVITVIIVVVSVVIAYAIYALAVPVRFHNNRKGTVNCLVINVIGRHLEVSCDYTTAGVPKPLQKHNFNEIAKNQDVKSGDKFECSATWEESEHLPFAFIFTKNLSLGRCRLIKGQSVVSAN